MGPLGSYFLMKLSSQLPNLLIRNMRLKMVSKFRVLSSQIRIKELVNSKTNAVTREWLKMKVVVVLLLLLVYQIVSGEEAEQQEWMLPKADVNQLAADITNGVISRLSE